MDSERRAAERAARADPTDLAAARTLAEALRRTGDRRALFHALCRLARAGDAEARAEVDAWNPWPGPDGPGNRRARAGPPLREPVTTRVARHPVGLPRAIVGVSPTRLVVLCLAVGPEPGQPQETLVALDLATLEVAWTRPADEARRRWDRGPALLVGEDVVWATTDDLLRVTAAADGAPRKDVALGLPRTADEHRVVADGDQVAVGAVDEPSVTLPGGAQCAVVVDLAAGKAVWRSTRPTTPALLAAFDGQAVHADGRTLALANGARTGPPRLDGSAARLARLPDGGLAALLREAGTRLLVALDAQGDRRWTAELGAATSDDLVVTGTVIAAVGWSDALDQPALAALDLATGARRWGRALPPTGSFDVPITSLAGLGPDLALLVAAGQGSSLVLVDAERGDPRLELPLDLPLLVRPALFGAPARVDFAELVPLDGALLVVASGADGELVVVRIEGGQ